MSNLKIKISQIKIIRKLLESKGKISNNRNNCVYCGLCEKVCSVNAITVSKSEKNWTINHNICVRCKHCISKCPTKALTLDK